MIKKLAHALLVTTLATLSFATHSAELDPKILSYVLPENVQWIPIAAGTNETSILYGDPE